MRVHARIDRRNALLLQEYGLTPAMFDVLVHLGDQEGVCQQSLADHLLVTKANICGLIDHMERLILVERRPDPRDRRYNRLYLTERARALRDQVIPLHTQQVSCLLDQAMSATDQKELHRLLLLLDRSLDPPCAAEEPVQLGERTRVGHP